MCLYDCVDRTVHQLKKEKITFINLQFICEGHDRSERQTLKDLVDGNSILTKNKLFHSVYTSKCDLLQKFKLYQCLCLQITVVSKKKEERKSYTCRHREH